MECRAAVAKINTIDTQIKAFEKAIRLWPEEKQKALMQDYLKKLTSNLFTPAYNSKNKNVNEKINLIRAIIPVDSNKGKFLNHNKWIHTHDKYRIVLTLENGRFLIDEIQLGPAEQEPVDDPLLRDLMETDASGVPERERLTAKISV